MLYVVVSELLLLTKGNLIFHGLRIRDRETQDGVPWAGDALSADSRSGIAGCSFCTTVQPQIATL